MNAKNFYQKGYQGYKKIAVDQSGITGLETAIVLIAFIVVAAVFAFTVLTTGLFTSEKARQTAQAGVGETQATLTLKGSVIATSSGCPSECELETISFKLAQAAGSDPVDLDPWRTLITYSDDSNQEVAVYAWPEDEVRADNGQDEGRYTATQITTVLEGEEDPVNWANRWLMKGKGESVDSGEVVLFTLHLEDLAEPIEANSEFRIEVIPAKGAVIPIVRRTPLELSLSMDLH